MDGLKDISLFRESSGEHAEAEVGVGELMTNIFGDDSDDEKEQHEDMRHQVGDSHFFRLYFFLLDW